MYDEATSLEEFHRLARRRKKRILWARILVFVLFFGLWELAARLSLIDDFITSSPSRAAETLIKLAANGQLWVHFFTTLYETVIGFTAGTLIGVVVAAALWWNDRMRRRIGTLSRRAQRPAQNRARADHHRVDRRRNRRHYHNGAPHLLDRVHHHGHERLCLDGRGRDPPIAHIWRVQVADFPQSRAPRKHPDDRLQPQDQRRHDLGRRHHGRIPRLKGRTRLSHRLRQPSVPTGSRHGLDAALVRGGRRHVLPGRDSGEAHLTRTTLRELI